MCSLSEGVGRLKIFNLLAIIFVPLSEELVVRGPVLFYVLTQNWLLSSLVIVASAFVWTIPHRRGLVVYDNKLYVRNWGWAGFNQILLVGIFYALSVVVAKSLWPVVLVHVVNNFGFTVESYLPHKWTVKIDRLLKVGDA